MLALTTSSLAFSAAPLAARSPARSPAVNMAGVDDMIGKYYIKGTVYDPLGFSKT